MMNPPYGERIAPKGHGRARPTAPRARGFEGGGSPTEFFGRLAAHWKRHYAGWTAWLLSPDMKLPGADAPEGKPARADVERADRVPAVPLRPGGRLGALNDDELSCRLHHSRAAHEPKIAFFGTGLMGAGFVRRARANGLRGQRLEPQPGQGPARWPTLGARAFDDPAAALEGAERIHLSLADDASVDAVLEPLAAPSRRRTWIVDHTTTAVRPTAERVARWDARGRTLRARAGVHGARATAPKAPG